MGAFNFPGINGFSNDIGGTLREDGRNQACAESSSDSDFLGDTGTRVR